jgi:hypothetical protein
MESQYVRNRFLVVKTDADGGCKLRCGYCESDIDRFVVAHKKNKWFTKDRDMLLRPDEQHLRELIVFADEADARAAGFHFRRNFTNPRSPVRLRLKSHS